MIRSKLKNRRVCLGFTQADIAQSAEIDRGYYANIENGKRNCSFYVWLRILKALEVPEAEFVDYVKSDNEKGA